jgi:hypothetical protein
MRGRAPVQLRGVRLAGRRLVFDVNDFDETLPGPFEWDVERQARRAHHQPGPAKRQSRHSRSS